MKIRSKKKYKNLPEILKKQEEAEKFELKNLEFKLRQ